MMDVDVNGMTREQLKAEVMRLRESIRQHRDEKGHDRCWKDHEKLYTILPEPLPEGAGTLPPHDEFLTNCERYWQSEKAGEAWCSERQRAEKAEAELLKWESGEAERQMMHHHSTAVKAATAMKDALILCRGRVVDVLHAIERSSSAERFTQPIVRRDLEVIDEALTKFREVNPGR